MANKKMTDSKKNSWDVAQVEYKAAIEQYRHYTMLRRQDMAFITTVQAAILTIIGTKVQNLDLSSFLLSLMAVFVLLMGINSEVRLSAYMVGYKERAKQIEAENNLNTVKGASANVKEAEKSIFIMSNRTIFPLYYFMFGVIWVVVWIGNLF